MVAEQAYFVHAQTGQAKLLSSTTDGEHDGGLGRSEDGAWESWKRRPREAGFGKEDGVGVWVDDVLRIRRGGTDDQGGRDEGRGGPRERAR